MLRKIDNAIIALIYIIGLVVTPIFLPSIRDFWLAGISVLFNFFYYSFLYLGPIALIVWLFHAQTVNNTDK